MDEKQAGTQERGHFSAALTPHRSLGPRGFLILMAFLSVVSFVTGVIFTMMGAWPVFGFFGLDVAAVYIAFRLNYRSARLYEAVDLNPEVLTVTRVHPSGRREEFSFNPYWVRVHLAEEASGRTDLRLRLHGREVPFGRFLNDDERRDFARVLSGALLQARGGMRI